MTGRVGVCIATSGPGATNLVTGLADALLDSVPLVAITGQVPRKLIGSDAFQETPIVEVGAAAGVPHLRALLDAFCLLPLPPRRATARRCARWRPLLSWARAAGAAQAGRWPAVWPPMSRPPKPARPRR